QGASVNVDLSDKTGNTPLLCALEKRLFDIVHDLLTHNASANLSDELGKTPLQVACSFEEDHIDIVGELLTHGATVDKADKYGKTPLLIAVKAGNLNIARKLLNHGASINLADKNHDTPLLLAIKEGHLEILKALLAHGADIDRLIHWPHSSLNYESSIRYSSLFDRVDYKAYNPKEEKTPLSFAVQKGNVDIVNALLAHGARVDKINKASLLLAAEEGYFDIFEVILAHDARFNALDEFGNTLLLLATEKKRFDVVKGLVERGTPIHLTDTDGKTPVLPVLEIIPAEDVNYWKKPFYNRHIYRDNFDFEHSPSDLEAHTKAPQLLVSPKRLSEIIRTVEHDLDFDGNGVDIDIVNMYCTTPLLLASEKGYVDIVSELLDHGGDVNMPNKNGQTPLVLACINGHLDTVKMLLVRGAAVDQPDKNGNAALLLTSERGHVEILKIILAAGADINRKNNEGKSAMDVGNDDVKVLISTFEDAAIISRGNEKTARDTYSIKTAIEFLQNGSDYTHQIMPDLQATASTIFSQACEIEVHRESVLTVVLMIDRIIRHYAVKGCIEDNFTLVHALKDVVNFFQAILESTQIWKIQLNDDPQELSKIENVASNLIHLQDSLQHATKNLNLDLNVQVMGSMEDLSDKFASTMDKMKDLDRYLQQFWTKSEEGQRMDELSEIVVQLQRGLEHYQRQLVLRNVSQNNDLELLVKSSQDKIINLVNDIRKSHEIPDSFRIDTSETWILSSNEVEFDPSDMSTVLGRGGYGTVFKGKYFGQNVAVKRFDQIFLPDSADAEKAIGKEIKAWKNISHKPYILSLVGVCTKIPVPILVSELCKTNIRRFIRDNPETLLPLVCQFAKGLETMHVEGIIHRDLKGDNVLITFQNTVAISDFGLGRTVTSLEKTTIAGTKAGTLNWMSPEQYFKPRSVTTKSDVWSFGMTLWEILCNDIPFRNASQEEYETSMFQNEDDRPEKPENFDCKLEPLWTLITMCWKLDPSKRPSAVEIVNFLESHYSSEINSRTMGRFPLQSA
ncbi:hypothetical protein LEN26_012558, partial [Aphanomyces euteiches]